MVFEAKFFLPSKEMAIKLECDLIRKSQRVMTLAVYAREITVTSAVVIHNSISHFCLIFLLTRICAMPPVRSINSLYVFTADTLRPDLSGVGNEAEKLAVSELFEVHYVFLLL